MKYFIQQSHFVLNNRYLFKIIGIIRNYYFKFLGMRIGKATYLPRIKVTWPNQICIGNSCLLEHDIYFKCSGIWNKKILIDIADNVFIGNHCEFNIAIGIKIGKNTMIASGCKFIDHDHGTELGKLMGPQQPIKKSILIEEDVWIGSNSIILKGVILGEGCVVGAGSVVTKHIPSNEIWGGVPAKKIAQRSKLLFN